MRAGRFLTMTALAGLCALCGCESPFFNNKEGTFTFVPKGGRGAAVVTENGVEFRDRADIPERVVSRDPGDPWRAPIGFILPASGVFTKTSHPTVLASQGIVIVLRPSDTRVPSWGGEILLRVDVHSPGAVGTARAGESLAVVIDGIGEDMSALTEVALSQLGAKDRMLVVDARGPRVVVPPMPATHRSLGLAATNLRLNSPLANGGNDLAGALKLAREALGDAGTRRIVVLSHGHTLGPALRSELEADVKAGTNVSVFGSDDDAKDVELRAIATLGGGSSSAEPDIARRASAIRKLVPPAGTLMLRDVTLSVDATPSPTHILESSGGDAQWTLEGGDLVLGDLRSGDARAEVMRITVPSWTPGKAYTLRVTARATDVALGITREFKAEIPAIYDDDIERIADSRHGDVIAYASALATLHRLHAAFVGEGVVHAGGLRKLARMHAESLAALSRDLPDRGFFEDAMVLSALLKVTED